MDALVAIGVHFALDDFGTGYSSLAYLRNFPVSTIKIDRSFVVGLPASEQAVAIVRAISVLAESLRMRVVAEGIETIDQVRFLRLLGCATGQGYLYGAAMPRHEFAALLEDQSERRAVS
jgi:EAL domain-containing protein (putative c-di-GMP-specific phosphodiesterase class I)